MKVLNIKTDEMQSMTIPEIIALIKRLTNAEVTSGNWVSHLQSIAKQYKVALPSMAEIDADIRHYTEIVTLNRASYTPTDKSIHIKLTELKSLKKQLQS